MSLFSQLRKEMILQAASKSISVPTEEPKKKQNPQSIKSELDRISEQVKEYFLDSSAQLITSRSQLHDYVTDMIDVGIGGMDTETTGLDRLRDTIVGSSLYFPGGVEVYIPNRHKVPIFETYYPNQLDYREVQEEFDRLRQKNVKLIYANADFDMAMIYKDYNVDFIDNNFYDVIIAWRCMRENEKDNALKVLYNKYVLKGKGHAMKFRDFFPPALFPYSNPEVAKLYAANDAKITYDLFKWQVPLITKDHPRCKKHNFESMSDLVWGVEFPMMKVCQNMHRRGVYLEPSYADMLKRKYIPLQQKTIREVQDMVQELMNDPKNHTSVKPPFASVRDFNPNSQPHKKWLCYDLLKLDGGRDKKTDKDTLSLFNLPVTNKILECTSLSTLIGTFVEKLPKLVSKENRIHCQFKQIGADCITADSIIPTKSGYFLMGELCTSAKDTNGIHIDVPPVPILNCNQEYEDAVSVIRYENCPTIKITTEYGFSIEGTYNHPIMVSQYNKSDISKYRINKLLPTFWDNRKYKELSDIKIGDIVEIPCNYHTEGAYQKTNIVLAKSHKACSTTIVPEIYTEEFAEFLGMYHADGDARFREGTYSVRISNCDSDVITRVHELCKKLFNVEAKTYTASNRINEATTEVSNIELSCLENILTHTAVNKRIPKSIWRSPTSVINSYIRGMTLDSSVYADSNNSNRIKFELNFANMEDCKFVQMHLVSLGILSSIVNHSHHSYGVTPRLKFNSDNYIRFRDIIGFISKSKYRESESNGKNSYDRIRVQNSFRATVIKIEYKYNDVYDFHVPATHSFISNGIISHNTGRMSSRDPNMQNIPSHHGDIRRMFRATPGYVIMSSDYSQQEPKLTAYVSQDPNMIKSFQEDKDIYSFIASIAFNMPYEECREFRPNGESNPEGKARRTACKSVVLGILYGRAIKSIAEQLYGKESWTEEKKVKQAQHVYDSVLDAFPALRQFMESSEAFVRKYGYTETILGRRRHIPDMLLPEFEFRAMDGYINPDVDPLDISTLDNQDEIPERIQRALYKELTSYKYFGQKKTRIRELAETYHIKVIDNTHKITEAKRQIVNGIIQGSAAELTKLAMLKVESDPLWNQLGGRILIPVHDELIAEAPIENAEAAGKRLAELMCEAANFLPFAIKCDVTTSYRWYGLEYPCQYEEPKSIADADTPSKINWILYHLFEVGYTLPVYRNPDGSKPEGDAAQGISGVMSEEAKSYIVDYMNRYNIIESDFINHIHTKVHTGYTPEELEKHKEVKTI